MSTAWRQQGGAGGNGQPTATTRMTTRNRSTVNQAEESRTNAKSEDRGEREAETRGYQGEYVLRSTSDTVHE